jgi:hypothetical protein
MKKTLFLLLLAAIYVSAVMGYYEKGKANILVAWGTGDPSQQSEQSPTFDILNKLRFGNPLWFIGEAPKK